MARRVSSIAGEVLCVALVTPMLLMMVSLAFGAVVAGVAFIFGVSAPGPSASELWPLLGQVGISTLCTAGACFITTRIGKTLRVAITAAITPFAFILYMNTPRALGARETLPPILLLLTFVSGAAGAYFGYRMSAKNQ